MAEQAKVPYRDSEDSLGSYLGEISNSHPLSGAEEVCLARRIKAGDEVARNELVEANLRFVVRVAKEYQNRGVPLSDLISSGNMGLITAAERFDEEKGFKFISYAVWWIRQAILQTLAEQSRTRGHCRSARRYRRGSERNDSSWSLRTVSGFELPR
jgi:RNA polymerase primary sigma factor